MGRRWSAAVPSVSNARIEIGLFVEVPAFARKLPERRTPRRVFPNSEGRGRSEREVAAEVAAIEIISVHADGRGIAVVGRDGRYFQVELGLIRPPCRPPASFGRSRPVPFDQDGAARLGSARAAPIAAGKAVTHGSKAFVRRHGLPTTLTEDLHHHWRNAPPRCSDAPIESVSRHGSDNVGRENSRRDTEAFAAAGCFLRCVGRACLASRQKFREPRRVRPRSERMQDTRGARSASAEYRIVDRG